MMYLQTILKEESMGSSDTLAKENEERVGVKTFMGNDKH